MYLYLITNKINDKKYVGISVNTKQRFSCHCAPSSKSVVAKAIQKYGKHSFSFKVLACGSRGYIEDLEVAAISAYKSQVPLGYNVESGGNYSPFSASSKLLVSGVKSSKSKLTVPQVEYILDRDDLLNSQLAEELGVTTSTIRNVRVGHTYKDVQRPTDKDNTKTLKSFLSTFQQGSLSTSSKLSNEEVLEIINNNTQSAKELSIKYYIGTETILNIRKGSSWKHIKRPESIEYVDARVRDNPRRGTCILSRNTYENVKKLLDKQTIPQSEISVITNTTQPIISKINTGLINDSTKFPED